MGTRDDPPALIEPVRPEQPASPRGPLLASGLLALALAALTALVLVAWPPLLAADHTLARRAHALTADHPALELTMRVVTEIGGPRTWWVVIPVVALLLLLRRRPAPALFVAVAGAGGGLAQMALKALIGRDRPEPVDPLLQATGHAFPSGHTSGTALGVTILLVLVLPHLPRGGQAVAVTAGVLLVVAVGASRVLLGVHWPSDVLGGCLLAPAWVLAVLGLQRLLRRERARPARR